MKDKDIKRWCLDNWGVGEDKQNWEGTVRKQCELIRDNVGDDKLDFSEALDNGMIEIVSQLLKEERERVIEDLDTNKIAEIQFNTEQEHHLNDGCHPTKCHHRKIDDLMKRLLKLLKE